MKPSSNLVALIERYFTVRLMHQRNVSANTIASCRDTFRLLLTFAQARLRKPPPSVLGPRRSGRALYRRVSR
jgi:integrase/recombinase XerD